MCKKPKLLVDFFRNGEKYWLMFHFVWKKVAARLPARIPSYAYGVSKSWWVRVRHVGFGVTRGTIGISSAEKFE